MSVINFRKLDYFFKYFIYLILTLLILGFHNMCVRQCNVVQSCLFLIAISKFKYPLEKTSVTTSEKGTETMFSQSNNTILLAVYWAKADISVLSLPLTLWKVKSTSTLE